MGVKRDETDASPPFRSKRKPGWSRFVPVRVATVGLQSPAADRAAMRGEGRLTRCRARRSSRPQQKPFMARGRLFMRSGSALALLVLVAACGSTPSRDRSDGKPATVPKPDVMAGLPRDSSRVVAVPLGEGEEPSISPDGRRVAYIRWQTVWIYDLPTGKTHQVCRNSNAHGVTWNRSGTKLAFQGDDSVRTYAKFWIWLLNTDGSDLRRISERARGRASSLVS